MRGLLALLALLAVVAAESVRETAIMNSEGDIFSGSLPDDDDYDHRLSPELDDDYDYSSGSGDTELSSEEESSLVKEELPMDNHIPDGGPSKPSKTIDEELILHNEVVPERSAPHDNDDSSNEIPMAITGPEGFFQRTEVIAALIAGGVVGLLFAVFLILLLYYRMKKKDEGSYDLGKKPIYKKAPTQEFYA